MLRKAKPISLKGAYQIEAWHKDGIITDIKGKVEVGRVYINGRLANTKGKFEHIVITLEQEKQK